MSESTHIEQNLANSDGDKFIPHKSVHVEQRKIRWRVSLQYACKSVVSVLRFEISLSAWSVELHDLR